MSPGDNDNTPAGAPNDREFRAGFVALVGRPNVGKSTLVNKLLGEKVSIVSPRPQTTRSRIHGILNPPNAQLILVDTPGLVGADTALKKALRRITGHASQEADLQLVVVECRTETAELSEADLDVLHLAQKSGTPIILAINKIDRLKRKENLLPWIAKYTEAANIAVVVPVSALKTDGLDILMREILTRLPKSPALFPTDLHTDQAERFLCGELVREQMLLKLRDEVPHSAAVVIESFEDERREDGKGLCRIEGRVYVERESQKGIVVGAGGRMIKDISAGARLEMEQLLGCKVYLRMTVHVSPEWTDSERAVRELGIGTEH